MDLKHLRYFLAVADAGHITRAAEALGMQQPPLSQQIKALEQELGVPLFRRHPRGVALTDAGRQLQAEAQRLVHQMDRLRARMARVASGHEGTLAVGLASSVAAHAFTPGALRAFRLAFPGVELVLRENNAAEITEAVAAGQLHCGILRVPVSQPEGLRFERVAQEQVLAALPYEHRLARGRPPGSALTLAELCGEGLILVRRPGAPGLYANLLALCEAEGLRPRVVAEVERMMVNLNLVAAGAGISVVPASMAGVHAHAVAYFPVADGGRLAAPLTLVWRDGEDSVPARHFVDMVRAMAA